jgi:hypothetical protein
LNYDGDRASDYTLGARIVCGLVSAVLGSLIAAGLLYYGDVEDWLVFVGAVALVCFLLGLLLGPRMVDLLKDLIGDVWWTPW